MYRGKFLSAPAIAAIALPIVDHFHFLALAIRRISSIAAEAIGRSSRSAGIATNSCSKRRCRALLPGVTALHAIMLMCGGLLGWRYQVLGQA